MVSRPPLPTRMSSSSRKLRHWSLSSTQTGCKKLQTTKLRQPPTGRPSMHSRTSKPSWQMSARQILQLRKMPRCWTSMFSQGRILCQRQKQRRQQTQRPLQSCQHRHVLSQQQRRQAWQQQHLSRVSLLTQWPGLLSQQGSRASGFRLAHRAEAWQNMPQRFCRRLEPMVPTRQVVTTLYMLENMLENMLMT